MKKTLLALLIVCAGCSSASYNYEVHLVDGGGHHHLITTETQNEAFDFMDEHGDSHGTMKVIVKEN